MHLPVESRKCRLTMKELGEETVAAEPPDRYMHRSQLDTLCGALRCRSHLSLRMVGGGGTADAS